MSKGIYKHQKHTQEEKDKISKTLTGRKFSGEHLRKIRDRQKGETHSRFKGNKANQNVLHRYVEKRKPKPEVCEECGKKKKLNLASLTNHNYTRNPDDYKWLCYSCHKKMDLGCSQCGKKDVKLHLVCEECIDWKNRFIKKLKETLNDILKINIENANKSGVSDKLKKQILEMMQGNIVEIDYRIDKLAGSDLI